MSFPEVLAAARALPRAEKLQLVHALVDDVGGEEASGQLTDAEVAFLRQFVPPGGFPPGAVACAGYQFTTDAAGWRVLEQVIAESKGTK